MKKRMLLIILLSGVFLMACKGEKSQTSDGSAIFKSSIPSKEKAAEETEKETETTKETVKTDETESKAEELLEYLELNGEHVKLADMEDLLKSCNIQYQSKKNQSGERIDIQLEDGRKLVFLQTQAMNGEDTGYELMLLGDQFNKNGFQENYLNEYDVTIEESYFGWMEDEKGLLKTEDLERLNQTDLWICRNQVFARRGRSFSDPFLQELFKAKSWYKPLYESEEFEKNSKQLLTETDKENLKRIISMEDKKGYRQNEQNDAGKTWYNR